LVGFEGEGPEHLCSCHCIGCIDLSSPWRFVEVKVRNLLLLGSWNPRRLSGFMVLLGDIQLSCGDLPKFYGYVVPWWWFLGASN
jgi:hypothetical protein